MGGDGSQALFEVGGEGSIVVEVNFASGSLYGDADAWKCCDRDRIFRDRAEYADYWGHPPLDAVRADTWEK
eukprot:3182610-Amphidinium_carterae.1